MTRVPRILIAGMLAGLAGLGFGPVFGGIPAAFLVAVAAVTAVAITVGVVASLLPRLNAVIAVLAGMIGIALVIIMLVRPEGDVRDGPWLVLTGALPVDPDGPALAAVTAFAGWTALAATLLAAYSAKALVPLLPPLVCVLIALGVGASGPPLPGWYAPVAVALTVAILAVNHRNGAGMALFAIAVTVGVAAVAGLLGPIAPGVGVRPPADARELIAAPVEPRSGVSPLQQFPALRNGTMPLRLAGSESQQVDRLRMATLSRFDGTYWTVDADYRTAGRTLPVPPQSTAARTVVRQNVKIEIPGPLGWLPTAGRPTTVSLLGLGVDEATGDLVIPARREVPREYTVESVMDAPTPDQIRIADPTRRPDAQDQPLPPAIRSAAEDMTAGQPSGSAKVLALLDSFTRAGSGFTFDQSADAPRGHGLYQIDQLLRTRRGTAEQYASAYAVIVRYMGYDTRVVMGFRPVHGPEGTFTATERNVDAWAEVRFEGLGWVVVDPTPRDHPSDPKAGTGRTPDQTPGDAAKEAANDLVSPPDGTPESPIDVPPGPASTGSSPLLIAALITAGLLVITFTIPLAKAVRAGRRRRATARTAVIGAWREALDRLREAGVPVSPASTTGDVLALTANRVPTATESLSELATMADRAGFAPDEPEPTLPKAAWTTADHTIRHIRRTMPPLRRITAAVDPRTFFTR
jgi:transglutaminase-like putative cysteine protease